MKKVYNKDTEKEKNFNQRLLKRLSNRFLIVAIIQVIVFLLLNTESFNILYLLKTIVFTFTLWIIIYLFIRYVSKNVMSDYEKIIIELSSEGIIRKIDNHNLYLSFSEIGEITESKLGTTVYKNRIWSKAERFLGSRTGEKAMKYSSFIPDILTDYEDLVRNLKDRKRTLTKFSL